MASIVYIADQRMIEYHRLNGNRTMNFWRPTTSRRILHFKPGDLLFFLAKGTERGMAREKGIVGYGRYLENHNLSFKQMWKIYGNQSGYGEEQELFDAIVKVSKSRQMPKTLSCLYLTDVVYFQAPIYLSEIGVTISNRIESYFYLDKDDQMATSKVLRKAKEVGVDMWTAVMSERPADHRTFEIEVCKHIISEVSNVLGSVYNETETKKAHRICRSMIADLKKQEVRVEMVKTRRDSFSKIDSKKVEVFLPLVSAPKEALMKVKLIVGHALLLKSLLKKRLNEYVVDVTVIITDDLSAEQLELFHLSDTNYLITHSPIN